MLKIHFISLSPLALLLTAPWSGNKVMKEAKGLPLEFSLNSKYVDCGIASGIC